MQEASTNTLSRRDFIKLGGAALATLLLAACRPRSSSASPSDQGQTLAEICSIDNVYTNLDECVTPAGINDLHLGDIGSAVEASSISQNGKDRLLSIGERVETAVAENDRIHIMLYNADVDGVPVVFRHKSGFQDPEYFVVVNQWANLPRDAENRAHELTHLVDHYIPNEPAHDEQPEWESEAAYNGILAGVAWCQTHGITLQEAETEYYRAGMYSITELLDKTGFQPENSDLFRRYFDYEMRYEKAEVLALAIENVNLIDTIVQLDPTQKDEYAVTRQYYVDLAKKYDLDIKTIDERWADPPWTEEERQIMQNIDQRFIPADFYTRTGRGISLYDRTIGALLGILGPEIRLKDKMHAANIAPIARRDKVLNNVDESSSALV